MKHFVVPVLAVLALAGCGSDSEGSSTTAATTVAPTTTISAATTGGAGPSTSIAGRTDPRDALVELTAVAPGPFASPDAVIDAVIAAFSEPDDCEVAPTAQLASRSGEGPVTAEVATTIGCDASVAGTDYALTISESGGQWTITAATAQVLCRRGVGDDVCV
ncbi:MAG: hypothetical protein QM733_15935 [Ilumatobacteraceae bacterium]